MRCDGSREQTWIEQSLLFPSSCSVCKLQRPARFGLSRTSVVMPLARCRADVTEHQWP